MRITAGLIAASVLLMTVMSGAGAQAEPAQPVGHDAAAKWRVTGKWVGQREGYGKVTLHLWRSKGRLAGDERSSRGCTWDLTFIKKRTGAYIFQEKTTSGGCGDFRIRLSRKGAARLEVSGGWMFDEVLHRP